MPDLARHLAFAACSLLVGSVADAAPHGRTGKRPDVATVELQHEVAGDDEDDDTTEVADEDEVEAKPTRARHHKSDSDDEVGFKSDDDESEEVVDAPVVVRKRAKHSLRPWHFAIGPNVWAASVDASVAVGAKNVSAAIDFFQLSRHTRYGVPVLVEGRYKRFSFVGDFLYGVVALQGANDVGPLMVTLDGTVSSLLVDGMGGFRVFGSDDSTVSLEARGGVRYQRTAIAGSVGVSGNGFSAPGFVDAGADALAGARVFVRPSHRFYFGGSADQSLFGSSTSTWSAGVDANLRITSHVLVAAGWRTLTQQKAAISTVMHGPRASLQLLF